MLPFEWIINIKPYQFICKIREVSDKLGISPSWLMMVIWVECRFNSQAVNKYSGAFGLIQFLPSTLAGLGYSIHEVKGKYGVWQLENLVLPYLLKYRGKMNSAYDVYLAVFYPLALGKRDDYVLAYEHEKAYRYNKILDTVYGDRDGRLEVMDVKQFFRISVRNSLRNMQKDRRLKDKIPVDYELNFY